MDEFVLTVQQWLNATYGSKSGYQNLFPGGISENGRTGTEVEQALVTALQIELGISSPTGTFGPATAAAFTSMKIRSSTGDLDTPTNKEYILQGGFWCKGYNPGGWTGVFYTKTKTAVQEFQSDAGLSNKDGVVTALIMKGLLNTDPYVLAPDGDSQIRQIQQNINNKYNAYTGLMPTNGVYVAQTNKALIYALQAEEGLSTSTANGSFGPTTTTKCPTLSPGDARTNYVLILQYALYCNHYPSGTFDGVYDSGVTSAVTSFQSFMCLPTTGVANMPTIKAALASCGDTSRSASACDCAAILTAAKAATLKNNGYLVVGRYLTGTAGGLSKALTIAEMQIIFNAGLRVMPIYESHGSYNEYFTSSQGTYDAYAAIAAAENLGIPSGEIIYFAVDYDAMDAQVTSHVIPYFQAVKSYFSSYSSQKYRVGIYGARNVCSRVCNAGYAVSSFVGDMSTGFSGNIGYTMPDNWAFDQFTTVTAGSGAGKIEIDKDGYSGRYAGVDHIVKTVNTPTEDNTPPAQPSYSNWADPVDTSIGAHVIQMTALGVKGAQNLSLDLSYNSAKLAVGTMGKGWNHNYEIKISKVYDSLYVYWSPTDYTTFTKNSDGTYSCTPLGRQNDLITVNTDGSYLLNRSNDLKYSFDSSGQLTSIQNRVGMNLTISRDSTGNLIITEPISGKTLTLVYNTTGLLDHVSDQSGRTASFTYGTNACLSTIADANGKIITYVYDDSGRVLTGTDGDGVCYFTDRYDNAGRIISQKDAINGTTSFSYDDASASGKTIVAITDRNGNTSKNIFNSTTKQLISTTDQNGNTKSYTYDSNGNIATETDELGNTASTTYDSKNHPIAQTDRTGSQTVRNYDSRGNLLSVTNPDGGKTTYTYDSSNRVISMTDTRSNVTTYTYNTNGLLTEKDVGTEKFIYAYQTGLLKTVIDPDGKTTVYSYDAVGRVASITDGGGNVTTYTYDALGNQLSLADPLGDTTSFTYNSRGNMLMRTDANGNTTSYQYNGNGKVLSMTDPKNNTTTYVYDAEDHLIQVKDAKANTTLTAYDPAGRILTKTDAQGHITAFTYDTAGNILTTTKSGGGVTTDTYLANGKLKAETDASGNTSTYSYDTGWRLSKVTNALGKDTVYAYSSAGDLLSLTDPLGNKTTYTYDLFGNLLTKIDPNGNVTTYTYDANNNRISQTDALGNVATYAYDTLNRLNATTDANGHTSSITYNAAGRMISRADALGNTATIAYDSNGNVVKQTDALGNIINQTTYDSTNLALTVKNAFGNQTTNTYDSLMKLVQVDDPLGNQSKYGYDATGRLITAIDSLNGSSSVAFDAHGNKIAVTNPLGGGISYTYDISDKVISETTLSGGAITYGYNAISLLSELTNARGQKRHYIYDDAGRIQSFTDAEGTTAYTYDANGNILTVTDAAGTITRQYNALNRVKKYTDVNGNVIQYAYDPVGNLSAITYPDGKTVSYAYDAANRLVTVSDWANRVTKYTYDANGNLTKTERPDGSILSQTYDAASRLMTSDDKDVSGNVIVSYSYTYDADGRLISENSSAGPETSSMTYDALGRLIDKMDKDTSGNALSEHVYVYDSDGNMTSGNFPQQNAVMTYDTNDRLNAYNGQNAAFDLDGNMIQCVLGGSSVNCSFDSANRLVQAGSTAYEYDVNDNRISSTEAGNKTHFVYDSISNVLSRLLVCTDSQGNSTFYVYGHGLLGHQDNAGYHVHHYDFRGSTVSLTDGQSVVSDRYTYGAYGELLAHTGTSNTPFLYNGRDGVMTEDNGLNYMRARYYSPELKRFINADLKKGIIDNSKTLNRYAYVSGDPISFVDPSGHIAELGNKILGQLYENIGATSTLSLFSKPKTTTYFNILIMSLLNEQKLGIQKTYGHAGKTINANASLEINQNSASVGISLSFFNANLGVSLGLEGISANVGAKVGNSTYYIGASANLKDTSLLAGVETETDTNDETVKNVSTNETSLNVNTLLIAAAIALAPAAAGVAAATEAAGAVGGVAATAASWFAELFTS